MPMLLIDSGLTGELRGELFYDFLAAALMTIGFIGLGVAAIQRARDLLLTYFALFSLFYGLRLGLERELIQQLLGNLRFYGPLRASMDVIVPVPFLLFLKEAGLLQKFATYAAGALVAVQMLLLIVKLSIGRPPWVTVVNNVAVISGLAIIVPCIWIEVRKGSVRELPGIKYAGLGFGILVAGVLWDNLAGW